MLPTIKGDSKITPSYINSVSAGAACANRFLEADINRPTTCLPAIQGSQDWKSPSSLHPLLKKFVVSILILIQEEQITEQWCR